MQSYSNAATNPIAIPAKFRTLRTYTITDAVVVDAQVGLGCFKADQGFVLGCREGCRETLFGGPGEMRLWFSSSESRGISSRW